MTKLQVQEPQGRSAPGIRLRLGSLVFAGIALGLRLARLDSPVGAALVAGGVLARLGLLLAGIALASRRRVTRARANWPATAAISASVNVAATMAPGSPPARRRTQMLTVTALLLPDRLVLVPGWSMSRRGGIAERDLPFDQLRAASWSTGYAGLRQIPLLLR